MGKIGLIADEGADLPKGIIEKHKIEVIPFKLELGELEKFEGNIYQKLRRADEEGIKVFVKTSQASPKEFLNAFKKKLKEAENIICITISSKLSGSFNSALQGRNFLGEGKERVHIIDSLTGSAGEDLLIMKAIRLIEEKLRIEDTVQALKSLVSKIQLIGAVRDPKWVEAGGRLSRLFALWIREMQKINIHPLLQIKKGRIVSSGLVKAESIPKAILKEFQKRNKNVKEKIEAIITHADNLKDAEELKEMIENKFRNVEVLFMNLIGSAMGGHLGPGTLILSWQKA